jgi:hypothetical protein
MRFELIVLIVMLSWRWDLPIDLGPVRLIDNAPSIDLAVETAT